MKGIDQLRKKWQGAVNMVSEVTKSRGQDVVAVEWKHEGHILKAYFNHSKTDFVLEEDKQI